MENEWKIEAHEVENYIRIVSDNGFIFDFNSRLDCLNMLCSLTKRDYLFGHTKQFQRFYIDPQGDIYVIDCDPWLNAKFSFRDLLCNVSSLSAVLGEYLVGQLK